MQDNNQGILSILDGTGDTRITWNRKKPEEVDVAKKTFDILVKEKNYQAFTVGRFGRPGNKIEAFDPELGKIILVPILAGG